MNSEEHTQLKDAYRKWFVWLMFEWSIKKSGIAYLAFFVLFLLMSVIGGGESAKYQSDSLAELLFVLVIGPAWLVFGAIIGSFLISEMQLAVFHSLKNPSEFAHAWVKEIKVARKNSFYQKWLGKL